MTHADYLLGRFLHTKALDESPDPFYALLQATVRAADSDNLELLRAAFPKEVEEMILRFNAPGGYLPGEKKWEKK